MTVDEAEDGQQVLAGHVYIAPGDQHLYLVRDGARYVCRLDDGEPVNRHKPSVDVLFSSVAKSAGENAIGVLLTGMGKDGAKGLKEMRAAGSRTVAQDEATSVVWGMPGEAVVHRRGGRCRAHRRDGRARSRPRRGDGRHKTGRVALNRSARRGRSQFWRRRRRYGQHGVVE